MVSQAKKHSLLSNVFMDKCPHCSQGLVFQKSTGIFKMPQMNEKCEKCDYRFDREPGYFLGAMYISYGFAVLQSIIAFVLCATFFPQLSTFWQVMIIVLVLLLFAKKNYKISRILYIHIFPW
ncbi:MAG: DUF983 domain-containing protein [Fluviicola sp.]|jgi:uncharacterized protein (DUF983 family)